MRLCVRQAACHFVSRLALWQIGLTRYPPPLAQLSWFEAPFVPALFISYLFPFLPEIARMASLKVVYRLTIMAGSLVVGGLAYVAYGPELETLKPAVERVRQAVIAALEDDSVETPLADHASINDLQPAPAGDSTTSPPADWYADPSGELTPISVSPQVDSQVMQAGLSVEGPIAGAPLASSVVAVVEQLEQLGVKEYSLSPWGEGGQFYRFKCFAPWGEGGVFSQQFEAVANDPTEAANEVLQKIAAWHHRSKKP